MRRTLQLSSLSTLPVAKMTKAKSVAGKERLIEKLSEIQDKLFAQKKYSVLIVLQGMDTSGKDNTVKNVFSGVNPAGCNVRSFGVPTEEEASHEFLWRINKECPPKGMMKIFNRSHYEDLLVPLLSKKLSNKQFRERCEEINVFEKGLLSNNTIILKFFLHLSHPEQLKRLHARRTDPKKRWKFQKEDMVNVDKHNQYRSVYESIFAKCSKPVPWQIIPADKKWYKNYFILCAIVKALEAYDIHYPVLKRKARG